MSDVVPVGWSSPCLSEITTNFQNGYAFSAKGYVPEGIPIISMGSIGLDGRFKKINAKLKYWDKSSRNELSRYLVKPQDMIMAMTDVTPTMELIGRACIVESEKEYFLNQRVGLIRVDEEKASKYYLSYYTNFSYWRSYCIGSSGLGAQANLGTSQILSGEVLLPPLPEQQKIAQILTSVDEVIEKTQAQIDKLKDLKIAMMQELLTKGIGHVEFKDSPVGRIPVGWQVKTLRDIAVTKGLQTGPFGAQLHAHEYVEQGIPVIMPKDMKNNRVVTGTIAKITSEKADGLERHKVEAGDILFSRRGDIGRFVLVEKKNEGWICGTGCLKARLNDLIEPAFFASYLTLVTVVEWLNNNAVGQTMLNLNTSILSDLPVMLPPKAEQKIIAKTVESLDQRTISLSLKYEKLQSIKKALMQDLLTGKVRVSTEQSNSSVAVD
jgi:type I restriction enzyme S subunit